MRYLDLFITCGGVLRVCLQETAIQTKLAHFIDDDE
jgi:hypothetical protein